MGCFEFCFIVRAIFVRENAQLAHNLSHLTLIKQKEKMPSFRDSKSRLTFANGNFSKSAQTSEMDMARG